MGGVLPSILIDGAAILFLWGLVWKSNNQRIESMQESVDGKVAREYCALQHRELHDDVIEIKRGLERAWTSLEEIREGLARENERRKTMEENK